MNLDENLDMFFCESLRPRYLTSRISVSHEIRRIHERALASLVLASGLLTLGI